MTMNAHLEAETMTELRSLMEAEFPTLVHAYLNDSRRRLEEMQEAIEAGQMDALRRACHSLKGSSSNLGAMTLTSLCLALEQQAKRGEMFGAVQQLQGIQQEFDAVSDELLAEIA